MATPEETKAAADKKAADKAAAEKEAADKAAAEKEAADKAAAEKEAAEPCLKNTHTADIILPRLSDGSLQQVRIAAGATVLMSKEELAKRAENPVVAHYLETGMLEAK